MQVNSTLFYKSLQLNIENILDITLSCNVLDGRENINHISHAFDL